MRLALPPIVKALLRRLYVPVLPSTRAVGLMVAAAPVGLIVAVIRPQFWALGPALAGAILVLVLIDGVLAGSISAARVNVAPRAEVGEPLAITVSAKARSRGTITAALGLDARLSAEGIAQMPLSPAAGGARSGTLSLAPLRRGTALIDMLWLRWTGPLGLGARHQARVLDLSIAVVPNLAPLRSPAMQAYLRESEIGLIARRQIGEGSLFETMVEFQPGMERRRIDWKVSARHAHLHAKQYETERNNQIVFALDCSAMMCEPVAGTPRIDRAVTAALSCAWVALKGGDKAALFGFAARVDLATPFVSETRQFHRLQEAAATLDYTAREANFTLAFATLSARLARRSAIVVFSDFADPTSAALMIEGVARLTRRHKVLFVTLTDIELESLAAAAPDTTQALAMAVSAGTLLRQRALALLQLRSLGVEVIEAHHGAINTRLIDAYLAIKAKGGIG